jgi:hypothetical protein
MTKATIVALAGLMAVSSVAVASMPRANAFGSGGRFIADPTDKWSLPSVEINSADTTYLEFANQAGTGDNWGGADMSLGGGVLGIYGNRPLSTFANINGGYTIPNSGIASSGLLMQPGGLPSSQIDLIFGYGLNDKTSIGIGVARAAAGFKTENATTGLPTTSDTREGSVLGVNVGAGLKELGAISELLIGLQYQMGAASNATNNGTITDKVSASGSDISLRVNGTINGDGGKFQGFDLTFDTASLDFKDEPSVTPATTNVITSKNTGMAWALGYASGMTSDKGQGLGGIVVSGLSQTNDESTADGTTNIAKGELSNLAINFVAAGEGKVNSVLTLRAGLSTELYGSTVTKGTNGPSAGTTVNTTTTVDGANTAATFGATLAAGEDMTVDTTFGETLNANAGVWGSMFATTAVTMKWGKAGK